MNLLELLLVAVDQDLLALVQSLELLQKRVKLGVSFFKLLDVLVVQVASIVGLLLKLFDIFDGIAVLDVLIVVVLRQLCEGFPASNLDLE